MYSTAIILDLKKLESTILDVNGDVGRTSVNAILQKLLDSITGSLKNPNRTSSTSQRQARKTYART
jgi:hypothetical protein